MAAVAITVMAMTENAPRANIGDRFILFLLFFQRLGRGDVLTRRRRVDIRFWMPKIPEYQVEVNKWKMGGFSPPPGFPRDSLGPTPPETGKVI